MKSLKIVFAIWVVAIGGFMSSVFLCGHAVSIDSWQATPWFISCLLTGFIFGVTTIVFMKTAGVLN